MNKGIVSPFPIIAKVLMKEDNAHLAMVAFL